MPTIKTNHNWIHLALLATIGISLLLYVPLIVDRSTSLTVGRFVGLVGLQLIWWQIVLGNRQLTRFFTPDLLWINKLHRLMGTYGYLLIVLHPLLMILTYGVSLVWPPSFEGQFNIGVRLGVTALMLLTFVWLVSALFRKKISWRLWKRLHFLGYIIFPLLYVHMLLIGSSMERYPWLFVWLNGIITIFWGIVLLRILGWAGVTKQRYRVVATGEIARDVTRFQLQPVGKCIMSQPGQFAYFQAKRFGEAHPFTVSHFDESSGEISFSIKAVGPYSRKLRGLEVNDIVFVDGPYGVFTEEMASADRPVVAIAGGIGITPFLRNLETGRIDYLFLGARTEADIAYPSLLESSRAKIYYVLSEASEREPGCETGIIDTSLLEKKLDKNLPEYSFYLCGPPPMMKALYKQLLEQNVPAAHIYQEKFSL